MAKKAHDYARVDKFVPDTRRAETANPYPPVLILITLIATLGIIRYAAFLLAPGNRGDLLPYLLVVGISLCAMAEWYRSIVPGIVLHGVNNAVVFTGIIAAGSGQ